MERWNEGKWHWNECVLMEIQIVKMIVFASEKSVQGWLAKCVNDDNFYLISSRFDDDDDDYDDDDDNNNESKEEMFKESRHTVC